VTLCLNRKETWEALEAAKEFHDTMIPGVGSWLDPHNNKAFLAGEISVTGNGISIYYAAKEKFPEIAADMGAFWRRVTSDSQLRWVGPEKGVIHLATAPKSNRAALAIWNAREDVRNGAVGEVPAHLRDAHYQGAQTLGHGVDYQYPHDADTAWVDQQYLPDEIADRVYYEPSAHGAEANLVIRRSGELPSNP